MPRAPSPAGADRVLVRPSKYPDQFLSGWPAHGAAHNEKSERQSHHADAAVGEPFAVANVEGQLGIRWNRDLAGEGALSERGAVFVEQRLGDVAEFVDETGDAGVRGADHGQTSFDA